MALKGENGDYSLVIDDTTKSVWLAEATIAAIPASGGLGALAESQFVVNGGIELYGCLNVGLESMTASALTLGPIVSNPVIQQTTIDFIEGFFVPGPPSPTPAGALGWFSSEMISE